MSEIRRVIRNRSTRGQDLHCNISTELAGRTEIELSGDPGIEIDAPIFVPTPGDSSRNLKILSRRLEGPKLTAQLEGLAGETYLVRIWTSRPIEDVRGGKLLQSEPKTVEVSFDSTSGPGFVRKALEVRFKQE